MKMYLSTLFALFILASTTSFAQSKTENPASPAGPTTIIKFEGTEFDFGEADQGEKIDHSFTFTNTGDEPLIISNAKGSCGCTVPIWPKEPVMPGESAVIEVVFDTKGKMGKQSKRVTITANTDPPQTFLTIKGMINTESAIQPALPDNHIHLEPESETTDKKAEEFKLSPDCVSLFPNPTDDILKLILKEYIGQSAKIDIYTDTGKQMEQKTIKSISHDPVSFDVSNYTPGLYTVTIEVAGMKPSTRCFIVSRH